MSVLVSGGCAADRAHHDPAAGAEAKAVRFLQREVPAWSRDNGCFSCHNNGDAARALYAASLKGYRIPRDALADTAAWVSQPGRWDHNKGDPGFSDKRLANLQFAASLLAAVESGRVKDRQPLQLAARKVAADQNADGAWPIEPGNVVGSPATYGTALATYLALRTLKQAGAPETRNAIKKAEAWLRQVKPNNVVAAATLLLASGEVPSAAAGPGREAVLKLIRGAQAHDGGWGPYSDSPPEVYDTALVLLALEKVPAAPGVGEMIERGRRFLAAQQNADGGWPATTRPSGGNSYAQRLSTTGWATLALLATRE